MNHLRRRVGTAEVLLKTKGPREAPWPGSRYFSILVLYGASARDSPTVAIESITIRENRKWNVGGGRFERTS